MTHARIVKAQMVDWIRNCVEMDLPSPTDDEIIDKFNLHGPASARSLLADLSEEGAITVSWNVPGRPISLGPKEKARFEPARPTRTVTHRSIAEEVADEALASSARRMHAKRVTSLTPLDIARSPEPDSPPPAQCPRADAAKGRSLVDTPPIRVEAAPQPVPVERTEPKLSTPPALEMKRLPTGRAVTTDVPRYVTHPKAVTSNVTREMYKRLGEIAATEGTNRSVSLLGLITEALTARDAPPAPTGKPRVRADVVKAWQDDGRPFVEFIEYLIDIGLSEYRRIIAYADAEAAE